MGNAIRLVENKANEAMKISQQNRDEKRSLKIRLAEQDGKVAGQDSEISWLLEDIDDLKNWSVRKTLVFKNRIL